MLNIIGLDHLGLKVTDMDRSLHFYQRVLGLEVVHTSGPHENGGRSATLRVGAQKIDVFYRPDFVSADRDKPIGMDHLCLTVNGDSMEIVMESLRQHDLHWLAHQLQLRTAEHVFRLAIHGDNAAGVVHHHDRIGGGLQEVVKPGIDQARVSLSL